MAFNREELLQKLTLAIALNPSITMIELAETVGISKASLHRIYSTKENLQEIIVQRIREISIDINKHLNQPHENYIEDLKLLIHLFCQNRAYILFVFRDIFSESFSKSEWERCNEKLISFFETGLQENIFNPKFNAETIYNVFSGIVTWILGMQAENGISESDAEEIILEAFLNGASIK